MTEVGDLIAGRYRLIALVGSGGMGVVWQARDEVLGRSVAVKELLIHAGMTETQTQEANRRAIREARLAARLQHPHAISVYDVVEHADRPCLVMEFLPSRSLSDLLAERRTLPPEQVARIGGQIASALAAAHAADIVHRDVKPGNVLLSGDGVAKLTDFGISRAVGDSTITATGVLAGTPAYLAPEVAQGHDADYASDVYSLGATLYSAVEGEPPFGQDDNAIAVLHRVATGEMTPPRHAGPITDALAAMLQRESGRRPTALQAEETFDAVTDLAAPVAAVVPPPVREPAAPPPPPPSPAPAGHGPRRWRRAVVIGLVAAVLVTTGVLALALRGDGHNGQNEAGGAPGTTAPATTATTGPVAGNPGGPATSSTSPTQASSSAPPSATTSAPAADVADQLTSAITGYYQVVPGDLNTGFSRMTTDYQRNHAGGMSGYQSFWQPIQSVSLSDVTATPPGTVVATVAYYYRDGHVVRERTQFGLVQQDGEYKIASSAVLSHTSTQG